MEASSNIAALREKFRIGKHDQNSNSSDLKYFAGLQWVIDEPKDIFQNIRIWKGEAIPMD